MDKRPFLDAAFALIGAFAGYCFGRRTKIDETRIKPGIELTEQIVEKFEQLNKVVTGLEWFVTNGIEHENDYPGIARAVATEAMYRSNLDDVEKLVEYKDELAGMLPKARVYLRGQFIRTLDSYLKTLEFVFLTDMVGFHDEYLEKLLENLDDPEMQKERSSLAESIRKSISKALL